MAVVIITTHADGGDEYVKNASNYPTNEDSVLAKGYGVTTEDPNTAQMQFANTAKFWNNQNKNPFIHFTCLFTPDEAPNAKTAIIVSFEGHEITPDKAMEIGNELCRRFLKNDYQYVLAVHTDTENVHCHIIFNAVNMWNGNAK